MNQIDRNKPLEVGDVIPLYATGGVLGVIVVAVYDDNGQELLAYSPYHCLTKSHLTMYAFSDPFTAGLALGSFWRSLDEEEHAILRVGDPETVERQCDVMAKRFVEHVVRVADIELKKIVNKNVVE